MVPDTNTDEAEHRDTTQVSDVVGDAAKTRAQEEQEREVGVDHENCEQDRWEDD